MSNSKEVTLEDLRSALSTGEICSLDKVIRPWEEPLTLGDKLVDPHNPIQDADNRMDCQILLDQMEKILTPRQFQVITLRCVIPRTPEEITRNRKNRSQEPQDPWVIRTTAEVGDILGVSGEYVGKVERRIRVKLRTSRNFAILKHFDGNYTP